ncbi:MAG: hypothetical protein KC620_03830 [Myxococcales bacterium]|nr:hypothetical protein [Myxococcales bacterium]
MSRYDTSKARPLGGGFMTPLGALQDADLAARLRGFKRAVAKRYRAMSGDEIETRSPYGPLWVQPKVDGELWFLVADGGEVFLSNPGGRVIYGDVPLLAEARALAKRMRGLTLLAGELFAVRKGGRPRHDDLATAMGGEANAEVARMGFMAFDLIEGGDEQTPEAAGEYGERHATLSRLLAGGKRVQPMKTVEMEGAAAIRALYDDLVASGKAEGLVLRRADGRIYKLKPTFTLDAVVIGYTERIEEPGRIRSMALAMMRADGQLQLIGSCGNMGTEAREAMFAAISPHTTVADFRHASHDGALYRFVRPALILEIKVTDILAEEPDGGAIQRMVAEFGDDRWHAVRPMPGVSILHPVFVRERPDKALDAVDLRIAQLTERVAVDALDRHAEEVDLPRSEILRREVYIKPGKGGTAVRKLVQWRTNKADADPRYPAFVVHFTDYSPGRKDPLQREVRLAPTFDLAEQIAEELLAANVKRGWQQVN